MLLILIKTHKYQKCLCYKIIFFIYVLICVLDYKNNNNSKLIKTCIKFEKHFVSLGLVKSKKKKKTIPIIIQEKVYWLIEIIENKSYFFLMYQTEHL